MIKFQWRAFHEQIIDRVPDRYWYWAWFSNMLREHSIVISLPWATKCLGSWSICILGSLFEPRLPPTVYQLHILTSLPLNDRHFWSEWPMVTPQSCHEWKCQLVAVHSLSGQPLHKGMNGHQFALSHGKIEESTVVTHFISAGHSEMDLPVGVIGRLWVEGVIQ